MLVAMLPGLMTLLLPMPLLCSMILIFFAAPPPIRCLSRKSNIKSQRPHLAKRMHRAYAPVLHLRMRGSTQPQGGPGLPGLPAEGPQEGGTTIAEDETKGPQSQKTKTSGTSNHSELHKRASRTRLCARGACEEAEGAQCATARRPEAA